MVNEIGPRPSFFRLPVGPPPVVGDDDVSDDAPSAPSADRVSRDTLELSEQGQKIVNLARANELAAALPNAGTDRQAFDAALKRGEEDIRRITDIFAQVSLAVSGRFGTGQDQASDTGADVIRLSDDSEKVVNLNQARVLAERIRAGNEADSDVVRALENARHDIKRITELFTETIREAGRQGLG
ncbi:MAG: hypothetical protein HN877_03590 [Rhodospirillaceae bacterium]|nr:hypothetical protein [Rhodospirillaceae bacterium]